LFQNTTVERLAVIVCCVFCAAAPSGCVGVSNASGTSSAAPPPKPAVRITTSSLPGGTVSQAYNVTVVASGGTTPYAWTLSAGSLPAGLNLGASSGAIVGTPSQSGTFSFSLDVKDSAGQAATASLSIQVASAPPPPSTLRVATSSLPNGTVSQTYSAAVTATGGTTPYTWTLSVGALATGLTLAGSTGAIVGTPSQSGTFSFTVQVKDSAGQFATASFSIQVSSAPPPPATLRITTSSLSSGTASQAYSATVAATGGTTPYVWALSAGSLPAGLNLGASSGAIAGTPSQSGTFSFTVEVKDSAGQSATAGLSIQIAGAPLQIVTSSLPDATVGQAYNTQLNAAGGTAPYTWSVNAGSLPAGIGLSSSGSISGSASASGSFSFTVGVKDANAQTASGSYTLTVTAAPTTSCDLYVSPTGSDANPGTLAAPWQTAQHALASVQGGQTICLRGGSYPMVTGGTYSQTLNTSGTSTQRITITNYPGEVAILHGSTRVNGAYATFVGTPVSAPGLIFEGPTGPGANLNVIEVMNTHDVTFDHIEIRNGDYHAGLYQYNGYNIKVLGSYIHDNGVAGSNVDQGIYWDATSGGGNLIANCVIEHNAAQGIALYSSFFPSQPSQVVVEENTVVNNGHYGIVVYGTGDTVVNNILANNGAVFNSQQLGIENGTNHVVDSNILWSSNASWQGSYNVTGQAVTHTVIADPLFVDAATHNYHLSIGSPAIGAGNLGYAQAVDKDNVSRGAGPDLGAYEYVP
jgi:parallel beta-helix repeat protein